MTLTQERHVERFNDWLAQFRSFLTAERGRASRLAEHLGVRRQNVSRWFVSRSGYKRDVPAWAAVTANVWYQAQFVSLGSDNPLGANDAVREFGAVKQTDLEDGRIPKD